MQSESKTKGVDFVVSRAPQPKNDNDGRQTTDRETCELLHVTELVAMDDTGAEVIKGHHRMKTAYLTDGQATRIIEHAAHLRTRATITDRMHDGESVA